MVRKLRQIGHEVDRRNRGWAKASDQMLSPGKRSRSAEAGSLTAGQRLADPIPAGPIGSGHLAGGPRLAARGDEFGEARVAAPERGVARIVAHRLGELGGAVGQGRYAIKGPRISGDNIHNRDPV